MTVVLLYTGIDDLFEVQMCLKSVLHWKELGLALGLFYPTLQKIEKEQHEKVVDCMMEMLAAWLQQQDNVSRKGVPSWSVLRTALKKIGETELASELISTGGELHLIKLIKKKRLTKVYKEGAQHTMVF